MISPDGQTRTVLLPATDWEAPLTSDASLEYAPFENKSSHKVPFPPLAGLLDALIESWLDCPSNDAMLLVDLACQISYLYAHVPALKQKSIAEQMKYGHHRCHLDVLAGMQTGALPFRRHHGLFVMRCYRASTSCGNALLRVIIRICFLFWQESVLSQLKKSSRMGMLLSQQRPTARGMSCKVSCSMDICHVQRSMNIRHVS